jgi:3-oxoacyl-[acyl-carrier-protein] synthase-1
VKRAYITATSLSCCGGDSKEELFSNICAKNSKIEIVKNYFEDYSIAIGKLASELEFFECVKAKCHEILKTSHLSSFENTLLLVGSSVGGIHLSEEIYLKDGNYKNIDPKLHDINTISYLLQKEFRFKDSISFSTACTSSANALGFAYEVITNGAYEDVLVLGADALSKTTMGGFLALGVLSSKPCSPFDIDRDGMNVSEAIACLLVSSKRVQNSIELCGVGYSSDAYHMTHPHPEGDGAHQAMSEALKCARLEPKDIGYINAHGTGTKANDSAEAKAIERLFGDTPYVSSTKSITGHSLGAAGALEAIICTLALKKQTIPTNTHLRVAENPNINLAQTNIKKDIEYVMSNSFAFGGNNCSLVFGKCHED